MTQYSVHYVYIGGRRQFGGLRPSLSSAKSLAKMHVSFENAQSRRPLYAGAIVFAVDSPAFVVWCMSADDFSWIKKDSHNVF